MRLIALGAVFAASLGAPALLSAEEPDRGFQGSSAGEPQPPSTRPADPGAATAPAPATPTPATSAPTPVAATPSPPPAAAPTSRATASAIVIVKMGDNFFAPETLKAKPGDTVNWINEGDAKEGHTVTGDGFDSGVVHQGDTYSRSFPRAGDFPYVCTLHPGMKGTVKVVARTSSEGGSTEDPGNAGDRSGGGSAELRGETHGAGSESAAVDSPGAAGSDSSLPATGLDLLVPTAIGLLLLGSGLLARRRLLS